MTERMRRLLRGEIEAVARKIARYRCPDDLAAREQRVRNELEVAEEDPETSRAGLRDELAWLRFLERWDLVQRHEFPDMAETYDWPDERYMEWGKKYRPNERHSW